jgi:tRNA pseudouridine38-40 synthase
VLEGNYHARYSASSRTYNYYIHTEKDPFRDKLSTYLFEDCSQWDRKAMEQAAAVLPNYSDFLSFCKVPDKHDSTICQLSEAQFYFDEQANSIRFQITANRFLRGMVRLIVAQLMDIGRGRITAEQFEQRIANGQRAEYFVSAPPQGLYLSKVIYPFLGEEIVVA